MVSSAPAQLSDSTNRIRWKKTFFRASGFGAGFAVTLVIVLAGLAWWSSRPARPKPWNKTAIRASYSDLTLTPDDNGIVLTFSYSLENTTDTDYHLPTIRLMQTNDSGVLENAPASWVAEDIFVPAHRKAKFTFTIPQSRRGDVFDAVDKDANVKIANAYLTGVHGFVAFDDVNKYEVDLPSKWGNIREVGADHVKN